MKHAFCTRGTCLVKGRSQGDRRRNAVTRDEDETSSGKKERDNRSRTDYIEALSANRIVLEVPPNGAERAVTINFGPPPATQVETVTIRAVAAEIEIVEIGPNQTLSVLPIRIVTGVLSDAVERTPYNWRDLDDALRSDRRLD